MSNNIGKKENNSDLILALERKDAKWVEEIFSQQRNIKLDTLKYISLAIKWGNLNLVKFLVKNDAVLFNAKHNALHIAAEAGQFEILQYFFSLNKIDPNIKNEEGENVLQIVKKVQDKFTRGKIVTIVKNAQNLWKEGRYYGYHIQNLSLPKLEEKGENQYAASSYSDMFNRDEKGDKELYRKRAEEAVRAKFEKIEEEIEEIRHLKERMFLSIKNGILEPKMLQEVLEKGVNINAPTGSAGDGETALHLACKNGDVKIAKLLIESGASAQFCNKNNDTAYDIALKSKNQDLIDCFHAPKKSVSQPSAKPVATELQSQKK